MSQITFDGECEVRELEPPRGGTLNVIAGCGTKKSYRTRQFFEALFKTTPNARIIVVSVRLTHAHDALNELGKFGFVVYNDEAFKGAEGARRLAEEPRLIISLESLHRIMGSLPPDVLVMDEVRTLCGAFGGKTLTRPESIDTLKHMYQRATYRLSLDADTGLDGAVHDLLVGLAGDKHIPITTWIVPKQVLHRKLRVGFKRDLCPLIMESLRTYAGVAPIAIACGRKADAKRYAKLLTAHGYTSAMYHGESSSATKRRHFSDPDTYWAKVDAVIFTSSLSVGVDPRKCKFGKIFLHTFPMGATLRDLFQGLCRFGRFLLGLVDDVIDVCLGCMDPAERLLRVKTKGLPPLKPAPVFEAVVGEVRRRHLANLRHLLACSSHAGLPIGNIELDSFVCNLEAWNEMERTVNQSRHHEMFVRLAAHRGWPIVYVKDEATEGLPVPGSPTPQEEERRIEAMDDGNTYEFVRAFVATEPGGKTEDEFFHDCYGCTVSDLNDTAKAIALRVVYFALKSVGHFPSTANYLLIKKHQSGMRNHVLLKCSDLNKLMLRTCEALLPGGGDVAHPMLRTAASKIVAAGRQLTCLLDLPSVLEDGTAVPQPFIDQIVAEAQAVKERKIYPFVPHSVEGKRRSALVACAAELGKVRCDHKDTLALIRTSLKKFNMSLDPPKRKRTRKRDAGGKVLERTGVIESITMRCKTRELQDQHLVKCGVCDTAVAAFHWGNHREEHDVAVAEESYRSWEWDEGYAAFIREQMQPNPTGIYTERFDKAVLLALAAFGPPDNTALQSAYNWVRRIVDCSSYLHEKSVLEVNMSYHRKHAGGYGRQWADAPLNLQTCPNILRPLIVGSIYHDIDVCNCHPKILLDVAARVGVKVPALRGYVEDREPTLRSLMSHYGCSRGSAKILVLRMLNGGQPTAWKAEFGLSLDRVDHPFVLSLLSEVRTLRDMMLAAYPEAKEHLAAYNRHAKVKKNEWSAFSWALCDLENRIIVALEVHLTAQGWRVDVLVFDGVMVRRRDGVAFTDADLRDAEAAVNAAMAEEGIRVRLEEKPMVADPIAEAWLRAARRGYVERGFAWTQSCS